MAPHLKISIIIPSLARPSLRPLLYSLKNQTGEPHEIIIVFDLPRAPKTPKNIKTLTTGGKQGQSKAKNLGAGIATGDILLFLEDDALAHKDLVKETAEFFVEHPEAISMAGKIIETSPASIDNWQDILLNLPFKLFQTKPKIGGIIYPWSRCEGHFATNTSGKCSWGGAGCWAIKKKPFQRIEGFDENLLPGCHFEEADLGIRLANVYTDVCTNVYTFYNPKAKIKHNSLGRTKDDYKNLRANEIYFGFKNLAFKSLKDFLTFTLYHLWQVIIYLILAIFMPRYFTRISGKILGIKHYLKTRQPKIYIDYRIADRQITGKEKYTREIVKNLSTSNLDSIKLESGLVFSYLKLVLQKLTGSRFIFYSANSFILASLVNLKTILVVHDLASFNYSQYNNLKALIIERIFLKPACLKARKIIVPSNFVKAELSSLLPNCREKIVVIPEG